MLTGWIHGCVRLRMPRGRGWGGCEAPEGLASPGGQYKGHRMGGLSSAWNDGVLARDLDRPPPSPFPVGPAMRRGIDRSHLALPRLRHPPPILLRPCWLTTPMGPPLSPVCMACPQSYGSVSALVCEMSSSPLLVRWRPSSIVTITSLSCATSVTSTPLGC